MEEFQTTTPRAYRPDDLAALKDEATARRDAARERPVVYLRCPECGNQMLRRTFGKVSYLLVNYCAGHGYWIARAELDGIAAYLAGGGEVLELKEQALRLEERIRQLDNDIRAKDNDRRLGPGVIIVPI